MDDAKSATIKLAKEYAEQGKPDSWFEEFYARAGGDINQVYWADLEPNPLLAEWLEEHPVPEGGRAVVVGCGLGDDAELLSQYGYETVAFDISPSAIDMCLQRYPESSVAYIVADLFNPPVGWQRGFNLVYECNTVQSLSGQNRDRAIEAIADLVAPGGELIVSCRSREGEPQPGAFPVELDRKEIDGFKNAGLTETHFLAYDDHQEPPVPHFFAVYQRLKS